MSQKKSDDKPAAGSDADVGNKELSNAEVIDVERPEPVAQKRGGGGLIGGLALLVALAAAGGVGWLWLQDQQGAQAQDQRAAALAALEQRVEGVASQRSLSMVESTVEQTRADMQAMAAEQQALSDAVIATRAALDEVTAVRREDWRLAEAEYLLRLANQSLLMGREVRGAQALLQAADDILREQDNPRWYPVRAAIATDLAALRVADSFDLQGTFLQLAALEARIPALQVVERGMYGFDVVQPNAAATDEAPGWWLWLTQLFDRYVLIRRTTEEVEPLLPPEEERYLRMNLQLMLEQAKLALMSRQQVVFVDSLTSARRLVSNYYRADTAANVAFRDALTGLLALDINPAMPDIAGSLSSLRDALALEAAGATVPTDPAVNATQPEAAQ